MDIKDISPASKRRLARWILKNARRHNVICVSGLINSAPSEFKLFKMCRYIDKCYEARQEASGNSQLSSDVLTEDTGEENTTECVYDGPETTIEENIDHRAKHKAMMSDTQKKYDSFSNRTKGRIIDIINKRMDIPISQIIMDADNEEDVIRAIEDIKEVPVNHEVRLWTVRQVV